MLPSFITHRIDPEEISFLEEIVKDCPFIGSGCFSCVFSKENTVITITEKQDLSKELLIFLVEKLGYEYLPKIEKIAESKSFFIYEMEKLTFEAYKDEEKIKLVNRLEAFRFWKLKEIEDIFLPRGLSAFFSEVISLVGAENIKLDFCSSNIGWRDNQPIFFDVFYKRA
jgi:hypothetical protein